MHPPCRIPRSCARTHLAGGALVVVMIGRSLCGRLQHAEALVHGA